MSELDYLPTPPTPLCPSRPACSSDACAAISIEEALWRAAAFADAGADVVFVDALDSVDAMKKLTAAVPKTPKMANMLEGGKTPILAPKLLDELGYKVGWTSLYSSFLFLNPLPRLALLSP